MIKYKERITKVIDYIICDSCKKNCKSSIAEDSEYATLRANWGYWSDSDGRNYELHLCEHCFYDVLGHIKAGAPKDIAICDKLKNFPSVNIVSIEESEDRRNILYEELEECKISNVRTHIYKRYNDEDHKIIESDAINHIGKGPVTSHLKTIREWYESTDEEYTIIFEDDVCFDTVKYWNFTWEEFFRQLPQDWNLIQLCLIREDMFIFFNPEVKLRKRCWCDWSACAYLISRKHAQNFNKTLLSR